MHAEKRQAQNRASNPTRIDMRASTEDPSDGTMAEIRWFTARHAEISEILGLFQGNVLAQLRRAPSCENTYRALFHFSRANIRSSVCFG